MQAKHPLFRVGPLCKERILLDLKYCFLHTNCLSNIDCKIYNCLLLFVKYRTLLVCYLNWKICVIEQKITNMKLCVTFNKNCEHSKILLTYKGVVKAMLVVKNNH